MHQLDVAVIGTSGAIVGNRLVDFLTSGVLGSRALGVADTVDDAATEISLRSGFRSLCDELAATKCRVGLGKRVIHRVEQSLLLIVANTVPPAGAGAFRRLKSSFDSMSLMRCCSRIWIRKSGAFYAPGIESVAAMF